MNDVFPFKKVLIVGPSGAGKSYFSRELSEITKLPLYPLDKLFWKPNWVETPTDEFIKIQKDILTKDCWIIDGSFVGTLSIRMEYADCIFVLDYDIEECIKNVKSRIGIKRPDLPDYLEEFNDLEFIEWIKKYPTVHGPMIEQIIKEHPNVKTFRFHNRDEKNSFISKLKKIY